MIKYLLCVALGAGIGSGVTYLVVKNKLEERYSKIYTEKIREAENQVRSFWEKRQEKEKEPEPEKEEEKYEPTREEVKEYKDKVDNLYSAYKPDTSKTPYHLHSSKTDTPVVPEEDTSAKDILSEAYGKMYDIVNKEAFDSNRMHYGKAYLSFYEQNESLVSDQGELLNILETLGNPDLLDKFGEIDEPEMLHVINHRTQMLYEIEYYPGVFEPFY